jgi:hypothetical protein
VTEHFEFLADPNEAEDAADHYMKKFGSTGAHAGQSISLVINVTQIPPEKLNKVERRVRELYDCIRVEPSKTGLIFKKPSLRAYLTPMAFERSNLVAAARALYRLILDEDVTVSLEKI